MESNINGNEVSFIRNKMKDNDSIRTTLETFSFTSVITVIGFGIVNYENVPCIIYLIPIIIIMIFSCRITYYIDQQSRWGAYLAVYHNEAINYKNVYNGKELEFYEKNKFISFITRNELLLLSFVCAIIYYTKFNKEYSFEDNIYLYLILLTLPLFLCIIQYKIISKAPLYTEKRKYYIKLLKNQ